MEELMLKASSIEPTFTNIVLSLFLNLSSFSPSSVCISIINYLLEKCRVGHQMGDERNYHIFYQLCSQADGSAEPISQTKGEGDKTRETREICVCSLCTIGLCDRVYCCELFSEPMTNTYTCGSLPFSLCPSLSALLSVLLSVLLSSLSFPAPTIVPCIRSCVSPWPRPSLKFQLFVGRHRPCCVYRRSE